MKRGFTLVEVLIFVGVLGVFFVYALAASVQTLRNIQISEHKILATRYSEELLEWLRGEKEEDWGGYKYSSGTAANFTQYATVCGGNTCTFCFNELDWNDVGSGSTPPVSCDYDYPTASPRYKRYATMTSSNYNDYISAINIDIVVEWTETGEVYSVPLRTVFTIHE